MAEENLGKAVLTIEIRDQEAKAALGKLRQDIDAINTSASSVGRSRKTTADPAETARRRAERAAEQAANKRVSIQNRLNLLEAKGVNVTAFRLRAARANEAAQQSQFDVARSVNAQLGRALSLEENRLRVSAAQTAQLKRQEAAAKSVASTEKTRAQKPTGVGFATTPEQILAGRGGTQKGAASSINTLNTAADKATQLRNRLTLLEAKGVDISKQRVTFEQAVTANKQQQYGTSQQLLKNLAREVSLAETDLRVANLREAAEKRRLRDAAAAERKTKAATTRTTQGQPPPPREAEKQAREEQAASRRQQAATAAAAKSRRQDLQGRISSGLIGGAFPLLFGQGPGAALGGLAGGVAGGGPLGFGLSLVGTGVGASFDALIARTKELAEALRDPIAAFDQLKTTSALSSRGLETYIEALIKSGQTAAAEQLIRADLTRTLNPTTAAALSQANDELARSFSDVQEKLAAITAGPAIAFLQWLDDIIDRLPIQGPAGAEVGQLPTAAQGRSQAGRGRAAQFAGGGLLIAAGLIATLATGGLAAVPGAGLIAAGTASVGAGALAAGTAANAAGARVPEDLATQQRTAGIQKEIEATQARRIALQKQLIGFTGNETSGAAQLAQTQQVVLASQQASLEALKTLTSLPQDASIDERIAAEKAYKEAVAASLIEVEKLIAANNNQARNLKRATDIRERTTGFSSSGRQGAVLTDAVVKAREDYDKAKAALEVTSIAGLEAARSDVNNYGQAWRSATQDLADYNAQQRIAADLQAKQSKLTIQGTEQRTADIKALRSAQSGTKRDRLRVQQSADAGIAEARRREQSIRNEITTAQSSGDTQKVTSLTNTLNEAIAETALVAEEGKLSLQEFNENARKQAFDDLSEAIGESAEQAQQAAEAFKAAQDRYTAAQQGLRSARESALQFLSRSDQNQLVSAARSDIREAGFRNTRGLSDTEILSAGQTARNLLSAESEFSQASKNVATALDKLADKNWAVNVAVSGGQSAISGDVLNGAISP